MFKFLLFSLGYLSVCCIMFTLIESIGYEAMRLIGIKTNLLNYIEQIINENRPCSNKTCCNIF